jgi:YesN/AraC family two-component response regulator
LKASNGKEAVDCFRREWQHIDLVLLDMMMPDMDGAEVFRYMKEIHSDVKVILVSGYSWDPVFQ